MEQGWVYVLVNSSIPGLCKVGRTTRPPLERAAELSAATGVATPFVLAFEQEFADCVEAERLIHAALTRRGLRLSAAREFFRGPASEIVRVVLAVAGESGDGPAVAAGPEAAALLAEGDRHFSGEGETLQDVAEAVRCYRAAACGGSLVALERLGAIWAQFGGGGRSARRRAMRYLKEGARRGNYYCLAEMAAVFAAERHLANFEKAWAMFFARRVAAPMAAVEQGEDRLARALQRYIGHCLALGLAPGHVAEMRPEGEAVVRVVLAALDRVRDAPELREHLVAVLRWTNATLLPAAAPAGAGRARPAWRLFWSRPARPRGAAA